MGNKRVGILTFHRAHNYGAVLQSYALQKFITSIGYETYILDYQCKAIDRRYKIFKLHKLFSWNPIKMFRLDRLFINRFDDIRKRRIVFNTFINERYNLLNFEDRSTLDCCILGSDQIWNKRLTRGYDEIYWGCAFDNNKTKVISYAASMEAQSVPKELIGVVSKNLDNLSAISVREDKLKDILSPLTSKQIGVDLDPTLMVDRSVWDELAKSNSKMPERYILIYMIKDCLQLRSYAEKMAKEMNAVVVELETSAQELSRPRLYSAESPEEFLMWFKNALCVLTLSFHGTAFSVIFNRPFFMFDIAGRPNSRVESLLSKINLSDRIIPSDVCPNFSTIEYTEANRLLAALQNKSRDYLISNIE